MLESVARSPFVNHCVHDSWQILSLYRLQLVTVATIYAPNCRQFAFSWSRCPQCMVEPVARSPLVSHDVHVAWYKLSLDRLQLITVATMHVRNCRQILFRLSRCPRCMVEPVLVSPLISHFGLDACHKLLLDHLFQSRCPRCMLETVARSPLVSHRGHDACQKLWLDRIQLVTVAKLHGRTCRQIAFSQSRCPRCMIETVARSPLVSHVVHDACQNLYLDRLNLITVATLHV